MGAGIAAAGPGSGFLGAGVLGESNGRGRDFHCIFVTKGYFSLAIYGVANVKLASSRGFSTDDTHISLPDCRIAAVVK